MKGQVRERGRQDEVQEERLLSEPLTSTIIYLAVPVEGFFPEFDGSGWLKAQPPPALTEISP